MNFRALGSVTGAVMLMAWTAPGPAIGQTTAPARWNPTRLADGQPDMQGHWISDAVGAAHSIEDGRDPKVFTRPWKIAFQVNRNKQANYEIFEDARHEGEQDVAEIIAGGRRAKEAGVAGIHDHRRDGR